MSTLPPKLAARLRHFANVRDPMPTYFISAWGSWSKLFYLRRPNDLYYYSEIFVASHEYTELLSLGSFGEN